MKVAFAGSFAGRIAEPVRARLSLPCQLVVDDEAGIRRTAFLINVGRAEILGEEALCGALARGRLAGTALDGWRYPSSIEPITPAAQPFHELGNVLMIPHMFGWTEGMLDAGATLIAGSLERTERGEPPWNVINTAP